MRTKPNRKKGTHPFSASVEKPGRGKRVRPLSAKPAPASQLRAQTRKVLAKHYRAKHGVR
jgi:hypothetical protein